MSKNYAQNQQTQKIHRGFGGLGHDRVEQQFVQHPQRGKLFSEYL